MKIHYKYSTNLFNLKLNKNQIPTLIFDNKILKMPKQKLVVIKRFKKKRRKLLFKMLIKTFLISSIKQFIIKRHLILLKLI